MTAERIDGKAAASALDAKTKEAAAAFQRETGRAPGLAAVLVGENPASEIYVRNKVRRTEAAGMLSLEHLASRLKPPKRSSSPSWSASTATRGWTGSSSSSPCRRRSRSGRVLELIRPDKDVDGFHAVNAGRLATGQKGLVPCTPLGCLILAEPWFEKIDGIEAVVIGRSNIVGRPMAQLLLSRRATVTVVHSATADVPAHARRADLLIAAAGRAGLVRGDWIKPGAVVIDVGINRLESGKNRRRCRLPTRPWKPPAPSPPSPAGSGR